MNRCIASCSVPPIRMFCIKTCRRFRWVVKGLIRSSLYSNILCFSCSPVCRPLWCSNWSASWRISPWDRPWYRPSWCGDNQLGLRPPNWCRTRVAAISTVLGRWSQPRQQTRTRTASTRRPVAMAAIRTRVPRESSAKYSDDNNRRIVSPVIIIITS